MASKYPFFLAQNIFFFYISAQNQLIFGGTKSSVTIQTNSNSFLVKYSISECKLALLSPFFSFSHFSPFLASKIRIIGGKSSSEPLLLLLTLTAPRMLPALHSPRQGRSLQRVPDPLPCSPLPVCTRLAASKPQDRPSHGTGEGTEKPMANPALA